MNWVFWKMFAKNTLCFATGFFATLLGLNLIAWLFGQVVATIASLILICLSVIAVITAMQLNALRHRL